MNIRKNEDLLNQIGYGKQFEYIFFWSHKGQNNSVDKHCLSQWYQSPFDEKGIEFPTAEHFMMYHKASLFHDSIAMNRVLEATNPGAAKEIGREVKGFDQEIWETERYSIVVAANIGKFAGNPELKKYLLNTGEHVLVEASPVDKVWGIGLAEEDSACSNPYRWKGTNLLGYALMEAREQVGHDVQIEK